MTISSSIRSPIGSSIKTSIMGKDELTHSFSLNGGTDAGLTITTSDAAPIVINWGDGTVETVSSGSNNSHTYAASYFGVVKVTRQAATSLIANWSSSSGSWDFRLSDLPSSLTYFSCHGPNTVGGNLSDLPSSLTYFFCSGSNTVTFTGSWYRSSMRSIYNRSTTAMSSTVCDDILNALATDVTTWTNEKQVNLHGSRTSASDSAVTTLNGLGVSVTVD